MKIYILLAVLLLALPVSLAITTSATVISPPIIKSLKILPENPDTSKNISCFVDFYEIFNERVESYNWLRNGKPTSFSADTIPSKELKPDDTWTCIVKVTNDYGSTTSNATIKIRETTAPITGKLIENVKIESKQNFLINFFNWLFSLFQKVDKLIENY